MEAVIILLGVLVVLAGIAGTALPLLPGPPLVFAGLWLIAWNDGYARAGVGTLAIVALLAALAWLVDHIAAVLGVKRVGASGLAVTGAFVGAFLGMFGGLPGVILGPIFGAVAGELIASRDHGQAARVGVAAGIAFIAAIAAKLGIVFAMIGVFGLAWWVGG